MTLIYLHQNLIRIRKSSRGTTELQCPGAISWELQVKVTRQRGKVHASDPIVTRSRKKGFTAEFEERATFETVIKSSTKLPAVLYYPLIAII